MTTKPNDTTNPLPDGLPEEWRQAWYESGTITRAALALQALASERKARLEAEAKVEDFVAAAKFPGSGERHRGTSVATQLVHCQHMREQAEAQVAQLTRERDQDRNTNEELFKSCEYLKQTILDRAAERDEARADNARLRELLGEARAYVLPAANDNRAALLEGRAGSCRGLELLRRIDAELAKDKREKEADKP